MYLHHICDELVTGFVGNDTSPLSSTRKSAVRTTGSWLGDEDRIPRLYSFNRVEDFYGQTGVSNKLLAGQEEKHTLFLDFDQVDHGGGENGEERWVVWTRRSIYPPVEYPSREIRTFIIEVNCMGGALSSGVDVGRTHTTPNP